MSECPVARRQNEAARHTPPRSGTSGGSIVVVFLASAMLLLWGLGTRPLYEPDEGRYGQAAHEMAESGDWVVPRIGGVPYVEKPPLVYWVSALGVTLVGHSEWGVRLPIALIALLGLALTYRLARELDRPRDEAAAAVAILATSGLYLGAARVIITDLLLCVSLLGAFLCVFRVHRGRAGAIGMWLCLALAWLAKGPVGPALFVTSIAIFWWRRSEGATWRALRPLVGPPLLAALVIPWHIAIEREVPGFLRHFYLTVTLSALYSEKIHHPSPPYMSIPFLAGGLAPWTLLVPTALVASWRSRGDAGSSGGQSGAAVDGRSTSMFLLAWIAVPAIIFTLSKAKLATYFLPIYPAMAILVARNLGAACPPARIVTWGFGGIAAAIALSPIALAFLPPVEGAAWLAAGAIVLAAGFAGAAILAARGQALRAPLAVLLAGALAAVPISGGLGAIDARASSRDIIHRNEALLREAPVVLSLRAPVGMVEFYLHRPVVHISTPHDFETARALAPEAGRFIEYSEVEEVLLANPGAVILLERSRRRLEKLPHFFPSTRFETVDVDEGFAIVRAVAPIAGP